MNCGDASVPNLQILSHRFSKDGATDFRPPEPEILIPPSGMARLNRTGELRNQYVLASPEEGNGYIGGLEVFHQLHCLVYLLLK